MSLVGALRVYTVTDTIGKAIGGLREHCDHIQYCTIEPHLLIQKSRQYVILLVTTVGGDTLPLRHTLFLVTSLSYAHFLDTK